MASMLIRNMAGFILPGGRAVSVGAYVAAWRRVKALAADTHIPGWSAWGAEAGEVLRDMRDALHDRINRRGGLALGKPITPQRLYRRMQGRVPCQCRWCGRPIPYADPARRFCDAGCAAAYRL